MTTEQPNWKKLAIERGEENVRLRVAMHNLSRGWTREAFVYGSGLVSAERIGKRLKACAEELEVIITNEP